MCVLGFLGAEPELAVPALVAYDVCGSTLWNVFDVPWLLGVPECIVCSRVGVRGRGVLMEHVLSLRLCAYTAQRCNLWESGAWGTKSTGNERPIRSSQIAPWCTAS